jgi:hypothetical protein
MRHEGQRRGVRHVVRGCYDRVVMNEQFHLAQVNIGRVKAPLDSPQLASFVEQLAPINALADSAPGFVWRLQTDAGNATSLRVLDDEWMMINMSVWANIETLGDFVYRSPHTAVMRQRRQWFEALDEAYTALWWVPAGHIPTVADAEERILHLRAHGPMPFAFTFREPFAAPGDEAKVAVDEEFACPA